MSIFKLKTQQKYSQLGILQRQHSAGFAKFTQKEVKAYSLGLAKSSCLGF